MVSWLRPWPRVCSVQHGGQINGFHGDTSALNAAGHEVHAVRAVNIVATAPVHVSRRAGSYSPRLRAQLDLLLFLLLLLLALFSHDSQSLCGRVPVSAVGAAGVDLRPGRQRLETLRNTNSGLGNSAAPPRGHDRNCNGLILEHFSCIFLVPY